MNPDNREQMKETMEETASLMTKINTLTKLKRNINLLEYESD